MMGLTAPWSCRSVLKLRLELIFRLILLAIVVCRPLLALGAEPAAEPSRFCQGFLYCKETKGDTTSTQAFLYLYSTEERGTYSRLTVIPFYSREMNPPRNYLRQSVLWPLGISERKGDASYLQILPFYWHADDPTRHYTILIPFYFDYAEADRRYTHFIPLYGHHQRGDLYHRYYVLGPLAIATYDKQAELKEWDILFPLFHHETDLKGSSTRLFPIYFSGESYQDGSWYRHMLPVYGRSVTLQTDLAYLFPLYGSFTDTSTQETRTSAIGFPPIPGLSVPALALYEHAITPISVVDRLFPLYHYSHTITGDLSQLNIMVLFQLRTGPTLTTHRLFPLYSYEQDQAQDHRGWSLLGYDQFSLAGYGQDPNTTWHQLIPLYRTSQNLLTQTKDTNVLGIGPLSLFHYWDSPAGAGHRFFPIYSYDHPSAEEWHWSALISGPLSLYRHDAKGTAIHDRFFPMYDWTRNGDWRELAVLGVSEFSMFSQESGPTRFAHRLFPLYRYHHDLASDEVGMETLFLHRHHSSPEKGSDELLFLWDATWQRQQPGWELDLLGIKPVTLFHQESSHARTANRLFPLYRYRHDLASDEVGMETLFLHRHHSSPEKGSDELLFLWDATWQRQQPGWELDLLGIKPVTLFHQESSHARTANRLFPLYGYQSTSANEWRLSLLGFPPREQTFAWSLYEQANSPTYFLTRLFPMYRFEQNDDTREVNWSALLLYRHVRSETHLLDMFPPLHEYERDERTGTTELNLVGLKPITLFKHGTAPDARNSYLFPLYDYDRTGTTSRLSMIGWPKIWTLPTLSLFEQLDTPSVTAHRLFPIYRYRQDEEAKTRDWDALLLWWHRETEQRMRDIFLPLADIEHDRLSDLREVGVLGIRPLTFFRYQSSPAEYSHYAVLLYHYRADSAHQRLSALGLPHFGNFPALSFFAMEQTPTFNSHRFFPVYYYANDKEAHTLNWQALFLWWHQQTESYMRNIFLPLAEFESESATDSSRLSLVGLPRIGALPSLTLFNWEHTPTLSTHRFFPVYQYTEDQTQHATNWNALWLYWHQSDPAQTRDTFFPLGSVRRTADEQTWAVSALGIEPVSLIQFDKSPTSVQNRFSPLWDYYTDGNGWGLSFVGVRRLSLFSHEQTANGTTDHLFPLWWHTDSPTGSSNILVPLWSASENYRTQEQAMGVLGAGPFSLYYQKQSPAGMTARVFPAWSYQYEVATQERHTGVLGVPPLSLYYGHTTPTMTENRLFPFFRYTSDRIKDESEFWFLWPLFDYKTAQGRTTETSLLWWLFEYRSPKADEREYWVLGHPPIAIFMRTETPTRTLVEVNPVIPGWRREYVEGVGTSWALLGGLLGMDAMPDGTHKLRLLWVLQL